MRALNPLHVIVTVAAETMKDVVRPIDQVSGTMGSAAMEMRWLADPQTENHACLNYRPITGLEHRHRFLMVNLITYDQLNIEFFFPMFNFIVSPIKIHFKMKIPKILTNLI